MFNNDLYYAKEYLANQALTYIANLKEDYILNCDFNELTNYIENKYFIEDIILADTPIYQWVEPGDGQRTYVLKCKFEISSGKNSLEYKPDNYTFSLGGGNAIPEIELDYATNILYVVFKKRIDIDIVEKKIEEGSITESYLSNQFNFEVNMFLQNVRSLNIEIKNSNSHVHGKIVWKLSEIYKLANRKISLRNALKISTMPISDIRNKKVELRMVQKNTSLPKANVNEPYYYISNEDYDLIIQIINRCMIQYERTPETFNDLGEEDIRNVILGAINANFNFSGSAESFSNKGHTDILVEADNKAAFIAECKLWKGKSYVSAGIDQLLNYATYKDGKLALLVFNKDNKDFNNVIDEMTNLIEGHKLKISKILHKDNMWQYKFYSKSNENSVTITFIVANYYLCN